MTLVQIHPTKPPPLPLLLFFAAGGVVVVDEDGKEDDRGDVDMTSLARPSICEAEKSVMMMTTMETINKCWGAEKTESRGAHLPCLSIIVSYVPADRSKRRAA